MNKITKKSQGEIFGIMIFFVLLVLGFFLYSQFKIVYTAEEQDIILENEYKILVDSTMQHIKNSKISCFNNDEISNIDLLNYCVENTGISFSTYTIDCSPQPYVIETCQTLLNNINASLHELFNGTSPLHSQKPFEFKIIPNNDVKYSHLNVTLSNLNSFNLSTNSSNPNYYLRKRYSKISSDFENIPTNQGKFEFELSFYHKR